MKKLLSMIFVLAFLLSMSSCSVLIPYSIIGSPVETEISTDTQQEASENLTQDTAPASQPPSKANDQLDGQNDGGGSKGNTVVIDEEGIGYPELINTISTETMKACVNITNKQYNASFGMETASAVSLGSGVIFQESTGSAGVFTYFVLTNYHVVETTGQYRYVSYYIQDYRGNQYNASLHTELNTELAALCESYDLAVMVFTADKELKVLEFASENAQIDDTVIAIGQPEGQRNTITIGKCLEYKTVRLDDGYEPPYSALSHSAPINHGNSGGVLININHEITAINFAGAWDSKGEYVCGYAIPVTSIMDFIKSYNELLS